MPISKKNINNRLYNLSESLKAITGVQPIFVGRNGRFKIVFRTKNKSTNTFVSDENKARITHALRLFKAGYINMNTEPYKNGAWNYTIYATMSWAKGVGRYGPKEHFFE
jgi:hypothetical protein